MDLKDHSQADPLESPRAVRLETTMDQATGPSSAVRLFSSVGCSFDLPETSGFAPQKVTMDVTTWDWSHADRHRNGTDSCPVQDSPTSSSSAKQSAQR